METETQPREQIFLDTHKIWLFMLCCSVASLLPRAGEAAQPSGFILPLIRLSSTLHLPQQNLFGSSVLELLTAGMGGQVHLSCSVIGASSIPEQMGLLEHLIWDVELPSTKKYPGPGACISLSLGAQGCSLAALL